VSCLLVNALLVFEKTAAKLDHQPPAHALQLRDAALVLGQRPVVVLAQGSGCAQELVALVRQGGKVLLLRDGQGLRDLVQRPIVVAQRRFGAPRDQVCLGLAHRQPQALEQAGARQCSLQALLELATLEKQVRPLDVGAGKPRLVALRGKLAARPLQRRHGGLSLAEPGVGQRSVQAGLAYLETYPEARKPAFDAATRIQDVGEAAKLQEGVADKQVHYDGIARAAVVQEYLPHLVQDLERFVVPPQDVVGQGHALLGPGDLNALAGLPDGIQRLLAGPQRLGKAPQGAQRDRPVVIHPCHGRPEVGPQPEVELLGAVIQGQCLRVPAHPAQHHAQIERHRAELSPLPLRYEYTRDPLIRIVRLPVAAQVGQRPQLADLR
jgi:hypothetical protein